MSGYHISNRNSPKIMDYRDKPEYIYEVEVHIWDLSKSDMHILYLLFWLCFDNDGFTYFTFSLFIHVFLSLYLFDI